MMKLRINPLVVADLKEIFELLRRGYKVTIGKNGQTEVDFVAPQLGQGWINSCSTLIVSTRLY